MKWHFVFIILIMSLLNPLALAKGRGASKPKAARYPLVQVVLGKVYQISEALTVENRAAKVSEKEKLLKKGDTLKDKAHLRVEGNSEIELQLSADSKLTILENSEIEIPGISWEDGAIYQVHLLTGKLRISCAKNCVRTYSNPLFESELPAGDFLLSYAPQTPSVTLAVLDGGALFRGLGNETELALKAGDMATFTVTFENNEIAFDILMKGRKVAKGRASEIQKIPSEEMQMWKGRDEAVRMKAKKIAEASVVKRKKSQICDRPFGELGQCTWKCEKNPKKAKTCMVESGAVCVRTRCDANGNWADRTELATSQSRCGTKSIVGACDY